MERGSIEEASVADDSARTGSGKCGAYIVLKPATSWLIVAKPESKGPDRFVVLGGNDETPLPDEAFERAIPRDKTNYRVVIVRLERKSRQRAGHCTGARASSQARSPGVSFFSRHPPRRERQWPTAKARPKKREKTIDPQRASKSAHPSPKHFSRDAPRKSHNTARPASTARAHLFSRLSAPDTAAGYGRPRALWIYRVGRSNPVSIEGVCTPSTSCPRQCRFFFERTHISDKAALRLQCAREGRCTAFEKNGSVISDSFILHRRNRPCSPFPR